MILYAVYPITGHGEPRNPVFISRCKTDAKRFLTYLHKQWHWETPDDYFIKKVKVICPKLGVQHKNGVNKFKAERISMPDIEVTVNNEVRFTVDDIIKAAKKLQNENT